MDQRKRKLMTMHKVLHSRDDVGRLYVLRKERGRGHDSIGDHIGASIKRLEDYIEKRRERLITATRSNIDDTRISRTTITRKQKWKKNSIDAISD